jgi:catechol 2,3-dioxygenase-like lactoylglutathione lyase family enzyme
MALLGVESLVYGVADLDQCTRFYEDFGLELVQRDEHVSRFGVAERSSVILRRHDDPALPPPFLAEPGPREIIWGVDSQESLDAVTAELRRDRPVEIDADGTAHCCRRARIHRRKTISAPLRAGIAIGNGSIVRVRSRSIMWCSACRTSIAQ